MTRVLIEVNRWSIDRLEKAIELYNKKQERAYTVHNYDEIIDLIFSKWILQNHPKDRGKGETLG